MLSRVSSRPFGLLSIGEPVSAWTLNGVNGLSLEILTYGGTVTKLFVPDGNDALDDVVLGFDDLSGYRNGGAFFGAIAGRVAGRITNARFRLDGREYQLPRNNGLNHLHGGPHGFDKKLWNAAAVDRPDGAPSLRLTYKSVDGEEGYPGTVDVSVTYTATNDNVFLIETEASADKSTPFSLTHHSYFNLAGHKAASIADHTLQIHADESVATDRDMTLLGRLQPVQNQANDFRSPRALNTAIPHLFQNHGDLYLLHGADRNGATASMHPAARLSHSASGRVLEVSTTNPYLQLYTAAALDGTLIGKSGQSYGRHAGVCLECEGYPDALNTPELGNIVLHPGETQRHTTAYAFRIEGKNAN